MRRNRSVIAISVGRLACWWRRLSSGKPPCLYRTDSPADLKFSFFSAGAQNDYLFLSISYIHKIKYVREKPLSRKLIRAIIVRNIATRDL